MRKIIIAAFIKRYAPVSAVLPRIMNFGRIQLLNSVHIFKNDEYEYELYSESKKLFEDYLWEMIGLNYSNNSEQISGLK